MKKHHKRSVPMIVQRVLYASVETRERACILAFTHGCADQSHFDTLLYVMNLLLVAGQTDKSRKSVLDYALNTIKPALEGIRQRALKTGKFGMNAGELEAVKKMLNVSREFWNRQTVALYKFSCDQVDEFYKELAEGKAAA